MPDEMVPKKPGGASAALAAAAARNLQERVASSLVMVAVALVLVYAGGVAFGLLVLGVALLMSWEWGHLVRKTSADRGFIVHAAAVAIAIGLATAGHPVLALCALAAGAAAVVPVTMGQRARLSAAGVLYVGLASVAILWLRSDAGYGFAAVLFLFLIVWTTDIMAFAVGRALGGAKLWPSISPNKTWAGFAGGIGSSAVLAAIYALFVPGASVFKLGAIGLVLGIVSQGGDLAESALKRKFGVKDASHLIPGHGGVMDRMDGIVAVAVAAAVMALLWKAHAPAAALLLAG
jgi:phosphatidate cytidylyltransferase